ncbi:MAG: pseudouridine synthase [Eubacteriales bacterium]|nr:pseudouridine synthase [Eubacteriales bacterium]
MALLRLDKYLCDMQAGTRSQIKDIVRKGRVKINGLVVKKPETKINTSVDIVAVDDKQVSYVEFEYFMLNKPAGVLSAAKDKKDRTVLDLIKDNSRRDLFPVGRLDKDTEGLLLITNDGIMSHELLTPKKHVDKVYFAQINGMVTQKEITEFAEGLVIDKDFTALPAKLVVLDYDKKHNISFIEITIHEGKFHQVKKMFLAVGLEVLYLKRLSMGPLHLDGDLKPGQYRKLTDIEILKLKQCGN